MTIAMAISDGQTIWAGADSAASDGDEIHVSPEEKVFLRGPYLFGYCGSYRVGQIVRYQMELPEPPTEGELTPFLVRELVPCLRRALEDGGAAGEGRRVLGPKTVLMVGCQGRIWCIPRDLTVVSMMPYAAIGSGRREGYAALHALTAAGVEPLRRRLELALMTTAEFTATVRGPFHFVTLGPHQGSDRGPG